MQLRHGRVLLVRADIDDLERYSEHRRLSVFYHKGVECANPLCDREGAYVCVTKEIKTGRKHVDVYTEDFVLMTVDHIYPRKQARRDGLPTWYIESLTNKQPMCEICNHKKSDKLPEGVDLNQMLAEVL